jgi:hypothetical protein
VFSWNLEFSWQILEKKSSCIKFNKTPSSGSRVVSCRRTEGQRERRTDLAKLQLAFRNSVKLLKIISSVHTLHFLDCYKFRNQQRLFPMQYSGIFDWQGMFTARYELCLYMYNSSLNIYVVWRKNIYGERLLKQNGLPEGTRQIGLHRNWKRKMAAVIISVTEGRWYNGLGWSGAYLDLMSNTEVPLEIYQCSDQKLSTSSNRASAPRPFCYVTNKYC